MNRIGIGYDLHRLRGPGPLILGGVSLDHHTGLEGHSDADVLVHALMDAMLGAAGKRDIGHFFPPGDPCFFNVSSLCLLARVRDMLAEECWGLVNADTVVIAEAPRLGPHIEAMRANIAAVLGLPRGVVSVKATTTEGLGVCGRREGIAAQAAVLLEKTVRPDPTGQEAE